MGHLKHLLRNLFRRQAVERELHDEIESFTELLADEKIAEGENAASARRHARLELGGAEQVKEQVRQAQAGAALMTLWQDVRYGARLLARSPGFTATAVISLALGIGANSAVFTLITALMTRALPVPNPQELVQVRVTGDPTARAGRQTGRNRHVSVPLWEHIRDSQSAFSGIFAFGDTRFNLAPQGEVRYVEGLYVSGSFFRVLGVEPQIGRFISEEDDTRACSAPVAMISDSLWRREFDASRETLNEQLTLGRSRYPIVGVMPAEFFGVEVGRRVDVVLPICASGSDRYDHWWLAVIGRLKPGWSLDRSVLAFTTCVACATCLLVGLAPALRASRAATGVRSSGRGMTTTKERFTARRVLVSFQVAVSFVLLFAAVLFTRSFRELNSVEAGFRQDGIITAVFFFRESDYPPERRPATYADLGTRLSNLPGVVNVAHASSPPLSGSWWDATVRVPATGGEIRANTNRNEVSSGYFRVMGTPLLAGRDFDGRDTPTSPKVAVVTEAFAVNFFGGADPVGRTFAFEGGAGESDQKVEIIGLVKNTKYYNLREEFSPLAFTAASQQSRPGLTMRYLLHCSSNVGSVNVGGEDSGSGI